MTYEQAAITTAFTGIGEKIDEHSLLYKAVVTNVVADIRSKIQGSINRHLEVHLPKMIYRNISSAHMEFMDEFVQARITFTYSSKDREHMVRLFLDLGQTGNPLVPGWEMMEVA
jgi:hypothetical protein